MNDSERNGLQEIIDKVIDEMAREAGDSFELDRMNLAEFSRRTGLSRSKARTLKERGRGVRSSALAHASSGRLPKQ